MRYWTSPNDPAGGVHVYVPQRFEQVLRESEIPFIVVTEGEKKAEAACKAGIPCVVLPGIWMFRDQAAKEHIKKSLAEQGYNEHDIQRTLANNNEIPVAKELLSIVEKAKKLRPALVGVLVLFDCDGLEFSEAQRRGIEKGEIVLPRNKSDLQVLIHRATKEKMYVLNVNVRSAGWSLAESLRRQLDSELRLPVADAYCPFHEEEEEHKDEKGKTKNLVKLYKQGLDDWIVQAGASVVKSGVQALGSNLYKMCDLLEASQLFGARADPNTLHKADKAPEAAFVQLIDCESVGRYENTLYFWKNTAWEVVPDIQVDIAISAFIKSVAEAKLGERIFKSCYRVLLSDSEIFNIPDVPDDGLVRVALQDAVVEVSPGGEIRAVPSDRHHGLRHKINANWADREQPTELWDRFLQRILPEDDVRRAVLQYIGYTLSPDTRFQTCQFWIGSGANGKSALAEVVCALHSRVVSLDLDKLHGFEVESLIGASLVHVDEVPSKIDEQPFKKMVSGGNVAINRKFKAVTTVRPTAKWVLLGNSAPSVSDQSDGFWRRLQVVDFQQTIPVEERDPFLSRKIIKEELSGVVFQILHHLSDLLRAGGFVEIPQAMEERMQKMRTETNSLLAWISNCEVQVVSRQEDFQEVVRVYKAYADWCDESNYFPVAVEKFWAQLSMHLPGVERTRIYRADETTGMSKQVRVANVVFGDRVMDADGAGQASQERCASVVRLALPPAR
ncbi:phage/plasmid primase, P4 family [Acidithiobacillus sp. IBUN Pt1247-S3]|uniref:phage/plasmid primase, P4 family n=1 Tax=Acidithiobacillus sp. IBUN Pt1247-S3 TaxID=3166642 RepID=UPI0034E396AE